jgi:hypothetical protein
MSHILHIERIDGKMKYRFKMTVPSESRKQAIEIFNTVADRYHGESRLISCRKVSEDIDPDDPDSIE